MPPGPLESRENDTEKRVKGSPTASAVCGKAPAKRGRKAKKGEDSHGEAAVSQAIRSRRNFLNQQQG